MMDVLLLQSEVSEFEDHDGIPEDDDLLVHKGRTG
jgi:hypothetical protein